VDEGLQQVVRWFLDVDDSLDFHQNLVTVLRFGPFPMFLEICMQFIPWYLH